METAERIWLSAASRRCGRPLPALQVCAPRNPTSKPMLTIYGGVATWEREIMLERQHEGIAKAKVEGKYNGSKPTVAAQADQVGAMRVAGEKPAAARAYTSIAVPRGLGPASVSPRQ